MSASETDRLLAAARAWGSQPLALATVLGTWGSAPRPIGSHMLIAADGRFEGSVSGGCVEGEVLHAGAEVIAGGGVRQMRFGVADAAAWEVGLPCGGDIEVLVQRVGADGFPPHLFERIAAGRAAGETVTVTSDLVTGAAHEGAKPGPDRFVGRYVPPRRLLIVGAVEIARFLCGLVAPLDVRPTVIDPRGRFLTDARFPGVVLDDRWPDEAVAAARPDASTALVTLSHDPKIDDPALIAALTAPTAYIGALGSKKSAAARLDRLRAADVDEQQLARIEGPVGLSIGAIGPAEIALSIAAAMVQTWRKSERAPGAAVADAVSPTRGGIAA